MLVEKWHGNTSQIILIILTLAQLEIEVYIACTINDQHNR